MLGSGQTETGILHAIAPQGGGAGFLGDQISFTFPLTSAPAVNIITSGTTAQCPGSFSNPTATSGNLCVYQKTLIGGSGALTSEFVTQYGVGIYMPTPAGTSYALFEAVWAVTR